MPVTTSRVVRGSKLPGHRSGRAWATGFLRTRPGIGSPALFGQRLCTIIPVSTQLMEVFWWLSTLLHNYDGVIKSTY